MPALVTHRLFGEESIDRLPSGVISSEEERIAFLLANQGPDPFFFRVRSLHMAQAMELARRMHRSRMSKQFGALRDGVSHLPKADAGLGRAFVLGLLSHYVLDRNAGGRVHAVIESDLDLLMLQLKRDGATVEELPPASELVTTDRVNKVAGALTSFVASSVYGLDVAVAEYGGAVADMQLCYRAIEPAGSAGSRLLGAIEGTVADYSLLTSLAHRVTREQPAAAGNMGRGPWEHPFTKEVSHESFPEIFDRALDDYAKTAARFIETSDMAQVTGHVNYSGRLLGEDEEFDREED